MRKETIHKFEGFGFHTWQVKVKGMLMKKGLWGIVKPLSPMEIVTTPAQAAHFHTQAEKALGLIITSIKDDYLHYINNADTALEVWDALERLFGAKDKHSGISLKMQLYGLMWRGKDTLLSLID